MEIGHAMFGFKMEKEERENDDDDDDDDDDEEEEEVEKEEEDSLTSCSLHECGNSNKRFYARLIPWSDAIKFGNK